MISQNTMDARRIPVMLICSVTAKPMPMNIEINIINYIFSYRLELTISLSSTMYTLLQVFRIKDSVFTYIMDRFAWRGCLMFQRLVTRYTVDKTVSGISPCMFVA